VLDVWYLQAYPGRTIRSPRLILSLTRSSGRRWPKRCEPTTENSCPRSERGRNGSWKLREDPPVLTRVDAFTKARVLDGLNRYTNTLPRERRFMLNRYHLADVAHRVVGVGSVGTRAYLALLFENGENDPLFPQVKESVETAHAPYLPPLPEEFRHNGKRVVRGQRAMQASSDPILGDTEMDGRDYMVRQMKNLQAAIPIEWLTGASFNF
jgi:uncharacterized protein (DUF2252 family)